jgi:hypothetical protein
MQSMKKGKLMSENIRQDNEYGCEYPALTSSVQAEYYQKKKNLLLERNQRNRKAKKELVRSGEVLPVLRRGRPEVCAVLCCVLVCSLRIGAQRKRTEDEVAPLTVQVGLVLA